MAITVRGGSLDGLMLSPVAAQASLELSRDYSLDYATIYRTSRAVQTAVSALARQIAQLGLHLYRRVGDSNRERVTDHPIVRLLNQPDEGVTRYAFRYALVADLAIFDRYYAVRVGDGDERRLVRLPPMQVQHEGGSWSRPERFRVGGTVFDADKVLYVHGYSPDASQAGVSPIESLRQALAEDWQAGVTREQLFRNGARFNGYLERPKDAGQWSADARARFKRAWDSQYTGSGEQVGGTPILEEGMTFKSVGMNAVDLQYIEARKLTREEVAAAYHIPAPMVGILDHATFANIREQHQMLYQDTLGPWLQMLQQELERELFTWFGAEPDLYLEFNIEEKMRGSFEEQAAMITQAVGAPWMTRNEARALRNMPRVGQGDELVTPMNVLAGDAGGAPDPFKARRVKATRGSVNADAPAPAGRLADQLVGFFDAQRAEVKAAGKSRKADEDPSWWDGEKWDRDLAELLATHTIALSTREARKALTRLDVDPDKYDVARTVAYLEKVASSNASSINAATRIRIQDALDEGAELDEAADEAFDDASSRRSSQIARTVATAAAAWAGIEAATQVAGERQAWKEWVVTSDNPRPEHARMNGERTGLDDVFSNGARWPGDSAALEVDDIAGCSCVVDVGWDD